jgi:hypothetical protein
MERSPSVACGGVAAVTSKNSQTADQKASRSVTDQRCRFS